MAAVISYDNNDPLGYGAVIFHHIPNAMAPSFQACLVVYSICTGVIGLEVISNLDYDWALARRSGWASWSKCPNRIAYFVSRYLSFTFLVMVIVFSITPKLNCESYARASNVMWFLPIICVDFIFMQRTIALYGWNRIICGLLYGFFVIDVGLAAVAVLWFGRGYKIPGSDFCAYFTDSTAQPHATLFIAYCVVLNTLDTLILGLTCHRLIEGGLLGFPHLIKQSFMGLFRSKQSSEASSIPRQDSIASLLMRQGLHYYAILEIARLAYMIIYFGFTTDAETYQLICTGILATVGPLLANRLFRETSEFVRARTVIRSNQNNADFVITSLPLVSPSAFVNNNPSPNKPEPHSAAWGKKENYETPYKASPTGTPMRHRNNSSSSNSSNTNALELCSDKEPQSFAQSYRNQHVLAPLPKLQRLDSRYKDPPLSSRTLVSQRSLVERPFAETLRLKGSSAPSSVSTTSFEIQSKRPGSRDHWM